MQVTTNNRTFNVEAFFIDLDGTLLDTLEDLANKLDIDAATLQDTTNAFNANVGKSLRCK